MAKYKVTTDREACIGCGVCASICPENWIMDDEGKAVPISAESDVDCNVDAAENCPVQCIQIEEIA
jgi:ferredoxin